MKYYVYYSQNGKVERVSSQPKNDLIPSEKDLLTLEVDYFVDASKIYVVNSEIKDLPPAPNSNYTFNYETFAWEDVRQDDERIFEIKLIRTKLLEQSDWTQIPNNPLTAEKQEEWAVYRQQLRDITSQSGYPFNVVWPTQPE